MNTRYVTTRWLAIGLVACATSLVATVVQAQQLQVCTSVPDLASLVQAVGGDKVSVTSFAKGTEDPHFIEAKPSFVKALSQANLLVVLGLGMEDGWSPVVLQNARNSSVVSGAAGYLDASTAIRPLDVPTGVIDRSLGRCPCRGQSALLA